MTLLFTLATPADVDAIVRLRAAVAEDLTRRYGRGHWSSVGSERTVLRDIRSSRVLLAWDGNVTVGTTRLATKRPWAIDPKYFTHCSKALYMTDMAVAPTWQRLGVGRRCLEQARLIASEWPAEAIRLDAYDGPAGAGDFYAKCGYVERGRVSFRSTKLVYYEMML